MELMAQTALNTASTGAQQSEHPTGLSAQEVQTRIERGETNDYEVRVSRTYWDIFRDNVLNLFNIVLFTLLGIVLLLGDYATAFFAGFSVVSNTFLGMIQEMQAKRRLDKLAAMSEQQVRVLREGVQKLISMREVVKDDLIAVEPGDRMVVDGDVVASDSLEMDESLLTGESDAVFKEKGHELYSGSFVVAGTGLMRATRVGQESNINKLSEIAKRYKISKTPTQKRIDIIVEITVFIMFLFVPLLFLHDLFVTQPPSEFLQAVRNAVVFVTSLVPQGLVLVAILSLTVGAIRISQRQTLVQRVNAVESLANASVLCFDKTGTLTKNHLVVQRIVSLSNEHEADDILRDLARYLANLAHLNRTAGAIRHYVQERQPIPEQKTKLREISFTSGRKWGAIIFEDKTLVLGAPERVFQAIGNDEIAQRARELTQQGLRVLALAHTKDKLESAQLNTDVEPLALIVMSDQIREDIEDTLQAFHEENIELKVVSGDNLETVRATAQRAGMTVTGAYSGDELEAISDAELVNIVQTANVFARVEPHTKQRIVKALQTAQHYVAMVGDGVNDVPALKQANLAIVMNDGTQISKDVADIVLLNNAMSTLPHAFAEGKEITQTIYGTTKLFLARNFYAVFLFIFVLFMALPFPITPVQISWVTLFSINIPATLIAFGFVRPQFMLNFRDDVLDFIITGGFLGAIVMTILYVVVYFGTDRDTDSVRASITIFQALYNSYLVMGIQGVSLYKPRTILQNWRVVLAMTTSAAAAIISMYVVTLVFQRDWFEFKPIGLNDDIWIWGVMALLMGVSAILLAHGLKYRYLIRRFYALQSNDERRVTHIAGEE